MGSAYASQKLELGYNIFQGVPWSHIPHFHPQFCIFLLQRQASKNPPLIVINLCELTVFSNTKSDFSLNFEDPFKITVRFPLIVGFQKTNLASLKFGNNKIDVYFSLMGVRVSLYAGIGMCQPLREAVDLDSSVTNQVFFCEGIGLY